MATKDTKVKTVMAEEPSAVSEDSKVVEFRPSVFNTYDYKEFNGYESIPKQHPDKLAKAEEEKAKLSAQVSELLQEKTRLQSEVERLTQDRDRIQKEFDEYKKEHPAA